MGISNMAKVEITDGFCPFVRVNLNPEETILYERGAMVFKTPSIDVSTRLNAEGSNLFSRAIKSVARSVVSGESAFAVEATAKKEPGVISLAPPLPGAVVEIPVGPKQYYLNDGSFLAATGTVRYEMEATGLGRALFGGTGGLFLMKTNGEGTVVINAFGGITKISLENETLSVDNAHVVAWDRTLNHSLALEGGGILHSIGTGEGIVNTFTGTGDIYIQSLNQESFVNWLRPKVTTVS